MTVAPGEIVTLIGPNGSGKSTTAKMALGILKPNEGRTAQDKRMRVSYVPQRLAINSMLPLSVGRFMKLTRSVSNAAVAAALDATGVSHLAGVGLRSLSGGEFQRVQLARAIAVQPDLLVLDEPIQGVDFTGEIALYDLIKRIRNDLHCGVLLISHDLHLVMAATDRVLCLNGHVCCSGAPTAVAASPEYKALFGEHVAATLAVYEHNHDHTHLPDGRVRPAGGAATDQRHAAIGSVAAAPRFQERRSNTPPSTVDPAGDRRRA